MNLNVLKLLQANAEPLAGAEIFDFHARDFPDYTLTAPVTVQYVATPEGGAVRLALDVQTEVSALCARCAEPFVQGWHTQKEFVLRRADVEEEYPDLPFTPNGMLEMDELVYGELVMDIPPILLCRENCEGLCQSCGKPKADCHCEAPPQGDPRLQVLKQLL